MVAAGASVAATTRSLSAAKEFLAHTLDVSSDALHVLASVLILLAASVLLKKAISNWAPWLAVFLLTCVNEAIDLVVDPWPNWTMQYGESTKDLVLTMALPTLLMVATRLAPQLCPPRADSPRQEDG